MPTTTNPLQASPSGRPPRHIGRKARRQRLALVLALALLGCGGGRGGERGPAIRNVLLVTFDTTRADHIGALGGEHAHTPVLDGLARRGVLFERCITAAPITLPSHTTILTGLLPFHHGARNNGTHHVPPEVTTLAEVLGKAGFETGAVVSAIVLDSRFGLDQGFDSYDDDLSSAKSVEEFVYRQVEAEDTVRRARAWLEGRKEQPWFLWVHFFDPHADYAPPARYLELCGGSAYDGEIAYADAELGRLLEAIELRGELDETLVVMTADHGESLGEHGEATHSLFVYDATTRVPLIFAHPELEHGKRVTQVVGSADIFPTILELMDLPLPGRSDGRSLAPVLRSGATQPAAGAAYSEAMAPLYNHGWSDLRSLRSDRERYIRAPRPELYDLERDPRELENLLPGAAGAAALPSRELAALLPDVEADAQSGTAQEMDPELRRSMDALGYVSGGEGGDLSETIARPDPKDKVPAWEKTLLGWGMVRAGLQERSLAVFREVIAEDPASVNARQGLATALRDLERFEEALQALEELVQLPAPGARSYLLLAETQHKLGRGDWQAALDRARDADPKDPMPWVRAGDWKAQAQAWEAARGDYEHALELDERCADAWVGLASIAHEEQHDELALDLLQRAVGADPLSYEAQYNLGVQREIVGRGPEAVEAYSEAARLDPKEAAPWISLGNLHLRASRMEEARAAYEHALERSPEEFQALYNLGQIELQAGDSTAAVTHLASACRLNPQHAEAWRRLMMACRGAKQVAEGRAAAEHVLELLPDDLQALMTAAVLAAAGGDEPSAKQHLERAWELDRERVRARCRQDSELASLVERLLGG